MAARQFAMGSFAIGRGQGQRYIVLASLLKPLASIRVRREMEADNTAHLSREKQCEMREKSQPPQRDKTVLSISEADDRRTAAVSGVSRARQLHQTKR